MTDFKTYYTLKFRQDINKFFSTIPDKSKFHEDSQRKQIYSVQYNRLTQENEHLSFLSKYNKEYFGVSLFFTVLIDMVCYSHYPEYYDEFQQLTRYPKFIGNCPGSCVWHFHPNHIFLAMNYPSTDNLKTSTSEYLCFSEKFNEAILIMEKEILDFFETHLKEIDGKEFWNKCKNEFSFKMKTENK